MKIIPIQANNRIYSSNAYLVLGDWRRIEDVNTLIDVGSDPDIVDKINDMNTGLGKRKVDQIILTHSHSDHTAALAAVKKAFGATVLAFSPHTDGVDRVLRHGEKLRMGDGLCDILHFPGHSDDSILIHTTQGHLFAGDTPVVIHAGGGSYDRSFCENMEALCRKNIQAIYFGHGAPLLTGAKQAICATAQLLRDGRDTADRSAQRRAVAEAFCF